MYNIRLNPQRKITYRKINYANFSNGLNSTIDEYSTPISYSKNTYNFDYKNGALTTGIGIGKFEVDMQRDVGKYFKPLNIPTGVDVYAIWSFDYYAKDVNRYDTFIVIYCSDKKVYYTSLTDSDMNFHLIDENLTFNSIPNAIKYKIDGYDCLILSSPKEGMYVFTGKSYFKYTKDCPSITSMCLHYERLFATVDEEKISLWFSDDLDPTNWNVSSSEAGFINLIDERGPLNKVISFKDYIYIFREYGITKISAYGDQSEFSVAHQFLSSTKIYDKTVAVCGDVILMLLKDGIYMFNGINVQKLNLNIENIIKPSKNACATYYNGKYYLACKIDFPDDEKIGVETKDYTNNALIEIDFEHGSFSIVRGVDINYLYSAHDYCYSNLFCCYKNDEGRNVVGVINKKGDILGVPLIKFWRSPKTDFGYPNKDKLVKELYFNAKQETEIIIETEKTKKVYKVIPKNGLAKVDINLIGREFAIHFRVNTSEAYISNPELIVGFY